MSAQLSWVTVATNDTFALGAIVLAKSLKIVNSKYQIAIVTLNVSSMLIDQLRNFFDAIVEIDDVELSYLEENDPNASEKVNVVARIHCWKLIQFEKCVFLDLETFVDQEADELFEKEELSAAQDTIWPYAFNTSVFVFKPCLFKHNDMLQRVKTETNFESGGIRFFNLYFDNWRNDRLNELGITYNKRSNLYYLFVPLHLRSAKIYNFEGLIKRWLLTSDFSSPAQLGFDQSDDHILEKWFQIFKSDVVSFLTKDTKKEAKLQPSSVNVPDDLNRRPMLRNRSIVHVQKPIQVKAINPFFEWILSARTTLRTRCPAQH